MELWLAQHEQHGARVRQPPQQSEVDQRKRIEDAGEGLVHSSRAAPDVEPALDGELQPLGEMREYMTAQVRAAHFESARAAQALQLAPAIDAQMGRIVVPPEANAAFLSGGELALCSREHPRERPSVTARRREQGPATRAQKATHLLQQLHAGGHVLDDL